MFGWCTKRFRGLACAPVKAKCLKRHAAVGPSLEGTPRALSGTLEMGTPQAKIVEIGMWIGISLNMP